MTTQPRFTTIRTEVAEGVATIWLNRPGQRNAFDITMLDDLHRCLAFHEADEAVRAIVVTGTGRHFSAGADMSGSSLTSGSDDATAQVRQPWIQPWRMRTPVIAAITGAAVGIGLTLPLTWDVRFAARDAKLAFLFTRRGVIPEWNAHWLLPRLTGLGRCTDLVLSGRFFTGDEACERGLVTAVFDNDRVLLEALELARDIASSTSPAAVAATKAALYRALEEPDREVARIREQEAFLCLSKGQDATEGMAAFVEKRDPRWSSSKLDDLPPTLSD